MVFKNVRTLWFQRLRSNKYQRIGQLAFNCLADLHPELARKVLGTKNDPFYQDDKIYGFWEWLMKQK